MTFAHKQPVAVHRIRIGVLKDGTRGWFDDWSEIGRIVATKREPGGILGWWVVKFDHGGALRIHEERLRAA
jgi:hypothetical protein